MRKIITLFILTVLVTIPTALASNATPTSAPKFSDLTGHWSEQLIMTLANQGIVRGFPDGSVRPDATITRGEYARLVAALMEYCDHIHSGEHTFDDTHDSWAHNYIEALVAVGIIETENDSFNPRTPITRIEMTRMLVYAIGRGNQALANSSVTSFVDDRGISFKDKGFVNEAKRFGLVEGFPGNLFKPDNHSSRAEAFIIVSRFVDAVTKVEAEKRINSSSPPKSAATPTSLSVRIDASAYSYTDLPVFIKVHAANADTFSWNISKVGANNTLQTIWSSGRISHKSSDSQTFRFTEVGIYQLSASATSIDEEVTTHAAMIYIFKSDNSIPGTPDEPKPPAPSVSFNLPANLHIDDTFRLNTITANIDGLDIVWSLKRNNADVKLSDFVEGTLNNSGGFIRFKQDGVYRLTATVTDGLGRTAVFSSSVTVYPIIVLTIDLPDTLHADQFHNVKLKIN
jgi:hypothetical protein